MLGDRAVAYKERLIRANALDMGDVMVKDGVTYTVLSVSKVPFADVLGDDETQASLLAELNEAGASDKVSKGFDEVTQVTAVSTSNEEDRLVLHRKTLYFPEYECVTVLV